MPACADSHATPGRYAAIDIGTVTARLLVADIREDNSLSEVSRDIDICNLGVGVDATHRLQPESIERVGQVIDRFMRSLGDLQGTGAPIPLLALATSASRDAENADDFRSRVAQAGVDVQVIPGEREAALSFAGASSAFPRQKVVVIDVGGGSTEIIAGRSGAAPQFAHSFDVGCRRVTERFFESDPPTPDELARAHDWIADCMRGYVDELRDAGCFQGRTLAVAGTATSAVSIREAMQVYDSARVHGAVVTRDDLDKILADLAAVPVQERMRIVGLEPKRAPVIVAGMLILQVIMQLADIDSFTVSERDILHGIIYDLAGAL